MVDILRTEWALQGVAARRGRDIIIRCHRGGSLVRILKYAWLDWRVIFVTEALWELIEISLESYFYNQGEL